MVGHGERTPEIKGPFTVTINKMHRIEVSVRQFGRSAGRGQRGCRRGSAGALVGDAVAESADGRGFLYFFWA